MVVNFEASVIEERGEVDRGGRARAGAKLLDRQEVRS
jgi:hypothetical protein